MPSQTDTSAPVVLDSLEGRIDLKGYPTPYSDVVALMVFEHQTHMTNLLTYIDWESRVAEFDRHAKATPSSRTAAPTTIREIAHDLVDYMLLSTRRRSRARSRGHQGSRRCFRRGTTGLAGPFASAARFRATAHSAIRAAT